MGRRLTGSDRDCCGARLLVLFTPGVLFRSGGGFTCAGDPGGVGGYAKLDSDAQMPAATVASLPVPVVLSPAGGIGDNGHGGDHAFGAPASGRETAGSVGSVLVHANGVESPALSAPCG